MLWMIIFHATYDLSMFNIINLNFNQGFWFAFPRLIAFTFLFCVGLAQNFTHRPNLNWTSLKKRLIKLGIAATLVSLVSFFYFPQKWIYFGTLHCIFFGSLFGALLVNHRKVAWVLLILILFNQYVLNYDIKWVSSLIQKPSMDFIPIYPWFWAILAGILIGPYLSRFRFLNHHKSNTFLNFLGRNSLKIYLLHQPLILSLIWLYVELVVR